MKRVLAMMAMAGALGAGPVYEITDLGTIGGSASAAFAINQSGAVAGTATDYFGNQWAVASDGGDWTRISIDSTAAAISGAGAIAGTRWVNGQAFATLWQDGSLVTVGGAGSYATALNEIGRVTGTDNGRVFVTTADGTIDLGLPAGAMWASGYDINLSGQVAGYSLRGTLFQAFVATPGGGFETLSTLGGNSYAMSINDAGTVAGHAQTASGYLHAAIWDHGGIVDLGTLREGGGSNSYAYGINNDGHVVGYSYVEGQMHAFLFRDGVMLDLNDLIDADSGWLLKAAYGINDAGQIAGSGVFGGIERAFRLEVAVPGSPVIAIFHDAPLAESTVPEPQTWVLALIGIGLCLLGTTRRRGRR